MIDIMSKEELEIMIYAYRPSIEENEKDSVLAFMVAAYNKALEDAIKVGEGDPYIYIYDIKKLRI